jgi:CheY-like chemotaxis protein
MVKHILYVDDDEDDRMIFSEAFEKTNGFDVITVESGRELLSLLREPGTVYPCLIIMDINMPQQTGIETLKMLRSKPEYNSLPVVMFSTSANTLESKECEAYGVDIIVKPSSFDDLRETQKLLLKYCENK